MSKGVGGVTFRNAESFWVFKTRISEVASIHQYLGKLFGGL